ncbi:MAG: hypothetical protein V4488_06355 [Pseudomonadota bacterium]
MAYPDWIIFQRTEAGRAEIQNKERGLTQSERLVLIIADGVSSYANLRIKLKSLVRERFDRAVRKLTEKGLLYEVMFPEEGQKPDTVDPEMMDRFLKQEDDDPVSIISFDPDEEYGDGSLDQNSVARIALQNSQTPVSQYHGQSDKQPGAAGRPARRLEPAFPVIDERVLAAAPGEQLAPVPAVPVAVVVVAPAAAVDFGLPAAGTTQDAAPVEPAQAAIKPASQPASTPVSTPVSKPAIATAAKLVSVFPEPKPPKPVHNLPQKAKPGILAKLRLNSSYILLFAGLSLFCAPLLARLMRWLMM